MILLLEQEKRRPRDTAVLYDRELRVKSRVHILHEVVRVLKHTTR